jgi:hypothetical protein
MAYQARCAVYLLNGKIYLKYLGKESASVATLTKSDIISGSLQIYHTITEDIVTDLKATWTEDYSVDDFNFRVRNNVSRYGVQTDEFDFWAFTQREPIERSASFWLNRNSRTWRLAKFSATLKNIHLTTFDTITLNLPEFGLSIAGCIVESVSLDVERNELTFNVWTPSLAGATIKYLGAYPDDVGYVIPFNPGEQYTPPPNHPVFRLQGVGERLRPSWERLYLPYSPPFSYPSSTNLKRVYDPLRGFAAGPG